MSRLLVVYGTRSGCTTTIAHTVADALRTGPATVEHPGPRVEVDVADAESPVSPGSYDAVVVGSGVRGGRWHTAAQDWVMEHADVLRETPVAFFTVGLTVAVDPAAAGAVRRCTDPLVQESGVEPVDVGVFPGWYHPHKLVTGERMVARALAAAPGDFRDLDAVRRWARAVLPRLLPPGPAPAMAMAASAPVSRAPSDPTSDAPRAPRADPAAR